MKHRKNQKKSVVKGTFSGVIISILIHAAAFLLAGLLVVFTVVKQREVEFEPPRAVERPKMKLKKPKVRVKKSSRPKSAARITTTAKRVGMPNMELPEMSGLGGGGFGGDGISGFDIMPDLGEVTVFGSGMTIGNDFVGTFYDFKRRRDGSNGGVGSNVEFKERVGRFVRSGWQESELANYYKSDKKLYATCFMVPNIRSMMAPKAFNEPNAVGWAWICHYKGKLVHAEGIKFRFWGQGDDILMVRVNGKMVLNASWPGTQREYSDWQNQDPQTRTYRLGGNYSVVGDWITLEPGVPMDMEVLLGEVPGGGFDAMLLVEEYGVEYERNYQNGPLLPIFRTTELGHDMLDVIYEWLVPGEACLTNGPVFCDFAATAQNRELEEVAPESEPVEEEKSSPFRSWTLASGGKTLEAEYIAVIGDKVALKDARGKTQKLPVASLSDTDREFIELENPPDFDVEFLKSQRTDKDRYKQSIYEIQWGVPAVRVVDYTFGVKIKQGRLTPYRYDLSVEYYAIGKQLLDDHKYKILAHGGTTFNMNDTADRTFTVREAPVELISYELASQQRGIKYYGYVYTIKDKRGKIIQYAASNKWLYEKLPALKTLPVGAFLNRDGVRVYPTGPTRQY